MRVTVLALGDLGRSPRIQLHAKALAESGCAVDLLGFAGSACWLLDGAPNVALHFLADGKRYPSRILRGLSLFSSLSKALETLESPAVVLVQTPPALPALWLASRFARTRGARAVFDWHNLGFSLLAQRTGGPGFSSALYRVAERHSARGAGSHLCVSAGLRDYLRDHFAVNAQVFEDRPARAFRPVGRMEREALRHEILRNAGLPAEASGLVIVSPTSWTRDEPFEPVLAAADLLDLDRGAPLSIIVTGRGELKESFEARVSRRAPGRVRFAALWFEGRDYARLLPGADLGLSLHASSSGLDFPMKIHDLHGSGLPVLARAFAGLEPPFVSGRDGFTFTCARELAERIRSIEQDPTVLAAMAPGVPGLSWEDAWQRDARSVILG